MHSCLDFQKYFFGLYSETTAMTNLWDSLGRENIYLLAILLYAKPLKIVSSFLRSYRNKLLH